MNLEQVAYFVAHPQETTLQHAAELKALTEKHPYAAVYSLLYLAALANGKSVDLDSALQQHAYRLSDRTNLYHLLHAGSVSTAPVAEQPVEIPAETPAHEPEPAATIAATSTQEEVATPEPVISEPESTPAETVEPTPEPIAAPAEEDAPEEPVITFDLVTEAFTREQHFGLDTETETPEEAPEPIAAPEPETIAQPAVEQPIAPIKETEQPSLPASAEQPANGKRSFTSWLKSSQPGTAPTPPVSATPVEKTAPEPEKKDVDALIENFIKEEPSITRGKTEFFSSSKKAKESLDEDTLPVSETLAKIYAAQGNYPKAIHVYHQLMLSFPEKKTLFAVQIEALKKKITP